MPFSLIVLFIILGLATLLVAGYFSMVVIFKVIRVITGSLLGPSLPTSIKRPLQEARDYAKKIRATANQCPPGPMRDRLNRTIKPVDEWLHNLNRLEQALANLYDQNNLNRDLRRVNSEIEQLRRQMMVVSSEETLALRDLMKSKKRLRAVLEELRTFQNQAELKIRRIASDLGTAHAEMLLVTTRGDFNENRFQRLDENLQDNMTSLRDMLAAMDEMGYSSATG